MLETIEDLWIILDAGIVLFTYLKEHEVNPDIFGGIVTVLDNFAEVTLKSGLEFFEIDPNIYIVIKRHHLIFIATAPQKTNFDDLMADLRIIVAKFFSIYPIDIKEKWNGTRNYFSDFRDKIESKELV